MKTKVKALKDRAVKEKASQAEGRFLVVRHLRRAGDEVMTYILTDPSGELGDLIVTPWEVAVTDPSWLEVVEFSRAESEGKIAWERTNVAPPRSRYALAPQYEEVLGDDQKSFALALCRSDYTPQHRDALRIDLHITDAGLPRANSRVSISYLKNTHLPFVRAVADLEGRFMKRPKVMTDCREAIDRIGAM